MKSSNQKPELYLEIFRECVFFLWGGNFQKTFSLKFSRTCLSFGRFQEHLPIFNRLFPCLEDFPKPRTVTPYRRVPPPCRGNRSSKSNWPLGSAGVVGLEFWSAKKEGACSVSVFFGVKGQCLDWFLGDILLKCFFISC